MKAMAFVIVLSMVLLSTAALAEEDAAELTRAEQSRRALVQRTRSDGPKSDVPGLMSYQGTLTDDAGIVLDTTVAVTFTIYDADMGGSVLWTETQPGVEVNAGLFNVMLGEVNALTASVFSGSDRWLGVQVGGDPELDSRQRIGVVPYAFQSGGDGDWTISGSDLYTVLGGNVGIGTTLPSRKLTVVGSDTLGSVLIAPYELGTGDDAELVLGEDDDGTYNMHFKYDGGENQLQIYGQATTTLYGPHLVVNRNDGLVGIGPAIPAHRLDVSGDVNSSTLYRIGGDAVLSTPLSYNVFVGKGAGENNTTNSGTFVGENAGHNNQGGWNTFVGVESGMDNTTGSHNTFLGRRTGYFNTTGVRNIYIGSNTGLENTTGSYNVFIGYEAGRLCTTGVSNVFLGYRAGYNENGSNKLYIDITNTSSPLIYGEFDNNIVTVNGDLGIATTTPTAKVEALNTGDNVGKLGTSEHGVYGESWDAVDLGGYFENRSTGVGGSGAYDNATALRAFSGTGTLDDIHTFPHLNYLYPAAAEFSGPNGVIGAASPDGSDGAGVVGVADGASQIPIYAVGFGDCNRVLYARNWNYNAEAWLAGSTYGAYAWADSGDGVVGNTHDSGFVGVHGENTSSSNIGQLGTANAGVYGSASTGYAGDFNGAVRVSGFLYKLGGGFIIDHPLDPENQYLYHSFVESPDMMNVYNGNVLLDANGQAWVELPEWFEAVNGEFRYQLTPIGGAAPGLHISRKISDNRFQIAGGDPGLEVSWQVTGIRQDPSARANRIPVEEYKPANERGYYLQPSVYGQSEERGIDWALYKRNRQRTEEHIEMGSYQGASRQDNRR